MNPNKTNYRNFKVAVYCRVEDVVGMADDDWMVGGLDVLQQSVKIDKVYLETHRSMQVVDRAVVEKAKVFFNSRGIQTSGGITLVADEHDMYRTFCYSDPEHRAYVRDVVAYTAELFDEVILDDFFFTNCKCPRCIAAKGMQSWSEFRLAQMADAAQNLVIAPAREVNPNANLILKYPNWYAHFHYTGYNLEDAPPIFDMIYTGTETRDPVHQHQHLQAYQSYALMRYLEHIKPGKNGGGWVDPGSRATLDRYSEQLSLTLFAKAMELTLFSFSDLLQAVQDETGISKLTSTVAPVAGVTLDYADTVMGHLGEPYGLASYRPYHSSGEDYVHHYLGMLGIPIDLYPEFPTESDTVLLTACTAADADIVEKIQQQLVVGKRVIITSGLLQALAGRGIDDIVELEYTDKKAQIRDFSQFANVYHSDGHIVIPQVKYATNDAWELITCLDKDNGYPLLLHARYGKGILYVLTIPDNFSDLYQLPVEILKQIRKVVMADFPVYLEAPSKVSLFTYDNHTGIIHSFRDHRTQCQLVVKQPEAQLHDLISGEEIIGSTRMNESVFELSIQPHTYCALRWSA
ncbi:MAG: hypothetical protein P1S60_11850 [Anaerolineae bacterium]|nr:hypothetical protein [Anaerolineae bacterium]